MMLELSQVIMFRLYTVVRQWLTRPRDRHFSTLQEEESLNYPWSSPQEDEFGGQFHGPQIIEMCNDIQKQLRQGVVRCHHCREPQ